MSFVSPTEQHYTPGQIAKLWALDQRTIKKLFRNEEGVILTDPITSNLNSRGKRRVYSIMRIPASVVSRVHNKMGAR